MDSSEPINPLKDVWLRPRRVFRELSNRPVGMADYALAAAQGIGNYLVFYQPQLGETHMDVWDMVAKSLQFGPIAGIIGIFLFAFIYGRLSARSGGNANRSQLFHVLAYSGVPVAATLILWTVTLLLVGGAAFGERPGPDTDSFELIIVHTQLSANVLLLLWSVVLQVMGISEIQSLPLGKAFGMWTLGQLVGVLAAIFIAVLVALLFPSLVPGAPP